MKTQTWNAFTLKGLGIHYILQPRRWRPDILHDRDRRRCFIEQRTNGTDTDRPDGKPQAPWDGEFTWIKGEARSNGYVYGVKNDKGDYEYVVRCDAGSGDLAWLKEMDRNYVFRLKREGRLEELEPNLRTEIPALYTDVMGAYLFLVLLQGWRTPESPLSMLAPELLIHIAEFAFPHCLAPRTALSDTPRIINTSASFFSNVEAKALRIKIGCLAKEDEADKPAKPSGERMLTETIPV